MIARILSIAGSDSGGGAGIQADLKTITMLGGHAMTAVTALTAQNTRGVDAIVAVAPDMVVAQIAAVVRDIGVDAVKIGMIGAAATAVAVAAALPDVPVVLDPVMIASSGAALADASTIAALERLMGRATVVTPNLPELAALTGCALGDDAAIEAAAAALAARHGTAVLAKGGHGTGPIVTDRLVTAAGITRWRSERIDTRHSHGTGCTLSSAIATGLGAGLDLVAATALARDYVRAALVAAPGLGGGTGPMGHGLGRRHFP